jgi:hypothetical protein
MKQVQQMFVSRVGMLAVVLAAGGLAGARPAGAVTRENFIAPTTADYVAVCSTPESDPLYLAAMAFCEGYGVGAYHYYHATIDVKGQKPFVCFPNPTPPRQEVLNGFVAWAGSHPQYAKDLPVETLFRYLAEKYPCPSDAADAARKE